MRYFVLCAMVCGCAAKMAPGGGGAMARAVVQADAKAEETGAAALPEEKLVITGTMSVEVDDGPAALAAIRADVEKAGGRVVHEHESGQADGWGGSMKVRLPPGDVTGFVERVAAIGALISRQIETTDVSREFFDQELAIKNLRVTADRLQALLAAPDLKTAEILEIEREMTRVRGDIERIEGEHRFLSDRIAWATIDVSLTSTGTELLGPQAALFPGVRGTLLYLNDAADGVDKTRLGVGVTLWFLRASSIEIDLYPSTDDGTGRAVIVTAGGGGYSDFLGAGKRRFLNPYLGGRIGYGWLDRHAFVAGLEAGVELFKHERVVVEAAGRGLAIWHGDGVDAAVQATAGVRIPF
jgi:hypothetical protein